jgi:hypothetical protein
MPAWDDVVTAAPELAELVRSRFAVRKHATLATLRRDGAPRISGSEVEFADGQLVLGSMPDARKAHDLQRDPRLALHSPTVDPPEADPSAWEGEAKISGTAREVPHEGSHRFVVDVEEIVFTEVEGDELVVRWWRAGSGEHVHRRH